jgi:hypothetical protein
MIVGEATMGASCRMQHWITVTALSYAPPIRKVYQDISECVEVYQIICTLVSNTVSLNHVSNKVRRAKWPHWICGHIIFVIKSRFLLSYYVIKSSISISVSNTSNHIYWLHSASLLKRWYRATKAKYGCMVFYTMV